MKAVRFHEHGPREVLRYEEIPDPVAGLGEVLVRVHACGVNRFDVDLRQHGSRRTLSLPWTLGVEFAGRVAACGPGVEDVSVGQRVWVLHELACRTCRYCLAGQDNLCLAPQMWGVDRPGGYAEYVVAPAAAVFPLADSVTFEVAAAAQAAWVTAWHMLTTRARVRAAETVLVTAVGSGVGLAALQVARLAGARVIATAGSPEKAELALAEGADAVIDHRREDVAIRARQLTSGEGVDVVVDNVGGDLLVACLDALRRDGRLVFCGAHGGAVVPLDLIAGFRAEWNVLGARTGTTAEHILVMDLVARGVLCPRIHAVLPLAEAVEAHRILEDREQFGRVVLVPSSGG